LFARLVQYESLSSKPARVRFPYRRWSNLLNLPTKYTKDTKVSCSPSRNFLCLFACFVGSCLFYRRQDRIAGIRAAQLIPVLGHTIDSEGFCELMVMKNQLPSATHYGIVCGSFLRTGRFMCGM